MATPEIIVDYREQVSELPRILKELGIKVIFRQLIVGDYIISTEVAIERKTIHDFITSLFDGRLFRQADELNANYKTPIILIEGDTSLISQMLNNSKVYYGALSSLILKYSVKTVFVPTVEDSAVFIERLVFNSKKEGKPRIISGQKPVKTNDEQINLLASLPGIGPKLAERMIVKFGSPLNAFNASLSDLAKIIGPAKAKKIKAVLLEDKRILKKNDNQSKLYSSSDERE